MRADVPKVMLEAAGRPLLDHVVGAARAAGCDRVIAVVGAQRQRIEEAFAGKGLDFVVQEKQRGTADALLSCRDALSDDEELVVLCGDAPLLRGSTIRRLVSARVDRDADVSVLTARVAEPRGYGRIVRGADNSIDAIVEERDASEEVRRIDEVNSGAYSFRWGRVSTVLRRIEPSPQSGEYYLTDAVREVRREGGRVVAVEAEDPDEILGANTPEQLAKVASVLAARSAEE